MKKILLVCVSLLLTLNIIGCSKKNEYSDFDFRNFSFGMTKEEVKKYEKDVDFIKTKEEDENFLFGKTKICHLNGTVTYQFSENKLNLVSFLSNEEYVNCSLYYDDYILLKENLIEKYGNPTKEIKNKRGDLYDDNIGNAIKYEEVDFSDLWELENGKIILQCYSRNYKPIVTIGFLQKDF